MSPDRPPESWAQIRYDYEHTDRPIEDICAEHGISSGTLRDRMRRWRWTRRRPPIPLEGPPAVPARFVDTVASRTVAPPAETADALAMPMLTTGDNATAPLAPDNRPITVRLQSAVDRVLPAIEATVGQLGVPGLHPREMERAARALASLTQTLRELSGLLSPAEHVQTPEEVEALRASIARKLEALIAEAQAEEDAEASAAGRWRGFHPSLRRHPEVPARSAASKHGRRPRRRPSPKRPVNRLASSS